MIGLGLLLVAWLYIWLGIKVSKNLKGNRLKLTLFWSAIVLIPTWFFLGHLLYPSYHQFKALCEANDRLEIFETREVNYLYLGDSSSCHIGIEYLNLYKGIECERAPKEKGEPGLVKGIFRFSRSEAWNSSSCNDRCTAKTQRHLERQCFWACSEKKNIESISNQYTYNYTRTPLVENRMYLAKKVMLENEKILARSKNYTYYPFGKDATMLNLASGSAPNLHCQTNYNIKVTDVFIPKNEE